MQVLQAMVKVCAAPSIPALLEAHLKLGNPLHFIRAAKRLCVPYAKATDQDIMNLRERTERLSLVEVPVGDLKRESVVFYGTLTYLT